MRFALGLRLDTSKILGGLDPDVQEFFSVLDANGESYWKSEVDMVDNLVKAVKASPTLESALSNHCLWVPVGPFGNNVFRAVFHKNGTGTLMTNSGFTSANWDRFSGLTNEPSFVWAIDSLLTESDFTSDDTHICFVSETQTSGFLSDVGNLSADTFQLKVLFGSAAFYRSFASKSGIENAPNTSTTGVFIGTRRTSLGKMWRDTTVLGSTARSGTDTPTAGSITLFRSSNSYARKRSGFISLGTSLSDADQAVYEAALQSARVARATLHQYDSTSEIFTNLLTGVPVDKQTDVSAAASLAASGQVYNELFVLESVYYANLAAHLGAGWGCTFTGSDNSTPALSGEGVQSVYSWSGNKVAEQTTPANRPIARSNAIEFDNEPSGDQHLDVLGITGFTAIEGWVVFDGDIGTSDPVNTRQYSLWRIGNPVDNAVPDPSDNKVHDSFGISTRPGSSALPDEAFGISIYNPQSAANGDFVWNYNGAQILSGTDTFSITGSPVVGNDDTVYRYSGLIHAVGFHEELFSAYRREAVRRFLAVLHNVPFNL